MFAEFSELFLKNPMTMIACRTATVTLVDGGVSLLLTPTSEFPLRTSKCAQGLPQ